MTDIEEFAIIKLILSHRSLRMQGPVGDNIAAGSYGFVFTTRI